MSQTNHSFSKFLVMIVLTFVLLSPLSTLQSADIYKWRDKKGNIVFSDLPPPSDVDAEIKQFKQEPRSSWKSTSRGNPYPAASEMVSWTPAQIDFKKLLKSILTPSEVFALLSPSVWTVISSSSDISQFDVANLRKINGLALGSAVATSVNTLLTNYHLVEERPYVLLKQGDRLEKAEIVSGHRQTDRCILSIKNRTLSPVTGFKRFSGLVVGETVFSIGSPKGLENTLGQGIISGKREIDDTGVKLIQTTAQISKGSSGGGLFDQFGNLIGMTTFRILDSEGLNFAIAIDNFAQ